MGFEIPSVSFSGLLTEGITRFSASFLLLRLLRGHHFLEGRGMEILRANCWIGTYHLPSCLNLAKNWVMNNVSWDTRNPRSLKKNLNCWLFYYAEKLLLHHGASQQFLEKKHDPRFHYYQEETENVTDPIKAVKSKGSRMLTADLMKHRFIIAAHLQRHVLLALI